MTQGSTNKQLALVAMIFAVAMTFIDQSIVSIAVPELQKDLGLSSTGVQWVVNGYLLSLAALFALGGRIADIAGHRRMVLIGIVIFAAASAMCGATPTDLHAQTAALQSSRAGAVLGASYGGEGAGVAAYSTR